MLLHACFQIIFHHVDPRGAVRKEGDPVCRLIRIDRRCHHLLPVVHEHFRAEPVKDDSQLLSAVAAVYQAPSLVYDRPS